MARIRSIKPEFFTSKTLSALTWRARLTFIGLWTYCDDYGRCQDDATLIRAALFIRDDDVRDADVEADLYELETAGLIVRYEGEYRGKVRPLMAIQSWTEHQKVGHPTLSRIPPPPVDNAEFHETYMSPHEDYRSPHETPVTGAVELGEQGSRGITLAHADARAPFDEFWTIYPRKVGKSKAAKAWATATRTTSPDLIIEGATRYRDDPNREAAFTAHPTTWLTRGGWGDDPIPVKDKPGPPPFRPSLVQAKCPEHPRMTQPCATCAAERAAGLRKDTA